MAFKKFSDFLNEQKKENKWNLPAKTDEPKDHAKAGKYIKPDKYYAPGAKKDCGLVTADGNDRGIPLGSKGSPGMTPKVAHPLGEKPADSPKKFKTNKNKLPKKMKTEEFLNVTSNMSDAKFTQTLLENQSISKPKIHDLYGRKYIPEPAETMRYVTNLMISNESMMSRMIREVKRNQGLPKLIEELVSHPETFKILNEISRTNERVNRKLNEAVAEPRGTDQNSGGIGPSGALAGRTPMVKTGNNNMPPGPPSFEDSETPEEGGMELSDTLDDDKDTNDDENNDEEKDGEKEIDDDENDDDDDNGETHVHIHHHHHKEKNKDIPKLSKKTDPAMDMSKMDNNPRQ